MKHATRVMLLALLFLWPAASARAQWEEQTAGPAVRLRGVRGVSAAVAWPSGDRGTYARTAAGGGSCTAGVVPGASELDFRDVEAGDSEAAHLLPIGGGERARIYKTADGGRRGVL